MTFGAGRAFAQKPAAKVTVSYSAAGGQYINLFVVKEFGIFEKHGLDVTLNQINSSSSRRRFALEERRCSHGTHRCDLRRHPRRFAVVGLPIGRFPRLHATLEPVMVVVSGCTLYRFSARDPIMWTGIGMTSASHHRCLVGGISIDYQFDPRRARSG